MIKWIKNSLFFLDVVKITIFGKVVAEVHEILNYGFETHVEVSFLFLWFNKFLIFY